VRQLLDQRRRVRGGMDRLWAQVPHVLVPTIGHGRAQQGADLRAVLERHQVSVGCLVDLHHTRSLFGRLSRCHAIRHAQGDAALPLDACDRAPCRSSSYVRESYNDARFSVLTSHCAMCRGDRARASTVLEAFGRVTDSPRCKQRRQAIDFNHQHLGMSPAYSVRRLIPL